MIDLTKLIGNKIDKDTVFTPNKVAEEMVYKSMPDDEITLDIKIIDIISKSGVFIAYWRDRLMNHKLFIDKFSNEIDRLNYILDNNLFMIAIDYNTKILSDRNVNYEVFKRNNIINIDNYIDKVKNNHNEIFKALKETFGIMKFDVVIGNPPYNRGGDIDFVHLGFQLSKKYVCMITPAKWQTAEADQKITSTMSYGQFRELIVPHMKYVCFYPDCLDVFGISQADGISYYVIDKNNTYKNNCTVENRCNLQPIINGTVIRDITHRQTLWNIGQEIIEYLGNYSKYIIKPITERKEYTVNINTQLRQSLSGAWDWQNSCIKTEYIGKGGYIFNQKHHNIGVLDKTRFLQGNTISDASASKDMFTSDSLMECNSFYYWINTKFTRFFILINISSLTILNNNTFRFVPAPPTNPDGTYNWTLKYTDKGLYEYYNLPQKYIDVIESVIKERK